MHFFISGLQTGSIDALVPETKEDFEAFGKLICEKIRMFSNSDHYNEFLETTIKDLAIDRKNHLYIYQAFSLCNAT